MRVSERRTKERGFEASKEGPIVKLTIGVKLDPFQIVSGSTPNVDPTLTMKFRSEIPT